MLLSGYDNEEGRPVTQNTQEIGQNGREVLSPGNTCHHIDDERKECPEETRNERERSAKCLHGETSGICIRDIVSANDRLFSTITVCTS